jgi:hypothetical protein
VWEARDAPLFMSLTTKALEEEAKTQKSLDLQKFWPAYNILLSLHFPHIPLSARTRPLAGCPEKDLGTGQRVSYSSILFFFFSTWPGFKLCFDWKGYSIWVKYSLKTPPASKEDTRHQLGQWQDDGGMNDRSAAKFLSSLWARPGYRSWTLPLPQDSPEDQGRKQVLLSAGNCHDWGCSVVIRVLLKKEPAELSLSEAGQQDSSDLSAVWHGQSSL